MTTRGARTGIGSSETQLQRQLEAALIGGQVRIGDTVGTLGAIAGECVEVGDLGDRERHAGLNADDAAKLPTACDHILPTVQIEAASLAEGQFVDEAAGEDVRYVA